MKESYWAYIVIFLGVFVISIMMVVRDYQTTNDDEYYVMKEVLQSAMIDSVDYAYWREHQDLRIIEEKFVENYLRRFAQSMSSSKTYKIQLYEISENPPKASVRVTTATGKYTIDADQGGVDFGVVNIISGILDTKHEGTPVVNNNVTPKDKSAEEAAKKKTVITDDATYYTVGFVDAEELEKELSAGKTHTAYYSININRLPDGVAYSKIKNIRTTISSIRTVSQAQDYLDQKAANDISMAGDSGAYNIKLSVADILSHSLSTDNMGVSGDTFCDSNGCTVSIAYTISNQTVKGKQPAMDKYYANGEKAPDVWFIPFSVKLSFEVNG